MGKYIRRSIRPYRIMTIITLTRVTRHAGVTIRVLAGEESVAVKVKKPNCVL